MDSISGTIEDAHIGEFYIFGKKLSGKQLRLLVCSCTWFIINRCHINWITLL